MSEAEHRRVIDLHRDADGNGLLVGPDCPDCERRAVVTYRCSACPKEWTVPGAFRWSWQGKGHFHEEDDPETFNDEVFEHVGSHGNEAIVQAVKDA